MEALEIQRLALAKTPCDWYGLFDDDRWLEPRHATEELPVALASEDIDMWYANSIFFQDRTDQFNATRKHCSPILWRVCVGDRFPLNRTIQATENVHDEAIMSGRIGTLKTPLLDYGTYTAAERQRLFEIYAEAGKNDPYTQSFIAPNPDLRIFPDVAVKMGLIPTTAWRDLYGEQLRARSV